MIGDPFPHSLLRAIWCFVAVFVSSSLVDDLMKENCWKEKACLVVIWVSLIFFQWYLFVKRIGWKTQGVPKPYDCGFPKNLLVRISRFPFLVVFQAEPQHQDETSRFYVVSDIFYFHPYLGKWSNLTNIFQLGWNHQLEWYDAIGDTVGRKFGIRQAWNLANMEDHPCLVGAGFLNHELFNMTWTCVVRMQDEAMRIRSDQCFNCVLTMNNNQLATSN